VKKIIHVHQNRIRSNLKNGTTEPPIIVRTYKGVEYGNDVKLLDKDGNVIARLLYNTKKPLSCGARVWLETDLNVQID
jgi:hypothetical protein